MSLSVKHEFIQANGINIHYAAAGEGPLVILLHGFPESWYAWRRQIPVLAEHFQVIAPDLRGYGETERPMNVSDYAPELLVSDLAGLIHALGHEKAHIVGHDWGGAIAWKAAREHPEIVDRLVVLNSPHPVVFAKALRSNFSQMRKSWYLFFMQIPLIPEFILEMHPEMFLKRIFRGASIRKEAFTEEDIKYYSREFKKPGAFKAAVNYYRAAFKPAKHKPSEKKIGAPTLLIWGEKDIALGIELTQGMEPLFSGHFTVKYIKDCGHFVNEEQPDAVNKLLLEFLSSRL